MAEPHDCGSPEPEPSPPSCSFLHALLQRKVTSRPWGFCFSALDLLPTFRNHRQFPASLDSVDDLAADWGCPSPVSAPQQLAGSAGASALQPALGSPLLQLGDSSGHHTQGLLELIENFLLRAFHPVRNYVSF